MNWQRNRLLRLVRARPRIFIATCVAVAVAILLPTGLASQGVTRGLIAWNAATGLYVLLAAIMMKRSSYERMRRRALLQDDGQTVILLLVALSTIASLAAIGGELVVVKDMHGPIKDAHRAGRGHGAVLVGVHPGDVLAAPCA